MFIDVHVVDHVSVDNSIYHDRHDLSSSVFEDNISPGIKLLT